MAGRKWTPEEKKASSERAKAAIAAKNAAQVPVIETEYMVPADDEGNPVTFDGQCIYCSLEFKSSANLFRHQQAMHGGEMPQQEPELPPDADKMPAGSVVRTRNTDGTAGIPLKTHWAKNMLERGWECDDPRDRIESEGGWRYIPDDPEDTDPRCHRCNGPMHQLSQMIHWDAPPDCPPVVVFQGLTYHIARGEENILPDIIVGQLRQSMAATKKAQVPPANTVKMGEAGRLATTGFLPPLDAEEVTA